MRSTKTFRISFHIADKTISHLLAHTAHCEVILKGQIGLLISVKAWPSIRELLSVASTFAHLKPYGHII